MNDDIIVINCYPNTIEKEDILENCIKQFKKTNKDILLVTHWPIKREIQQLVDYFIYDKNNPILDNPTIYWYKNENLYMQSFCGNLGAHSFAVLLSIQNAVSFAKHLNKKIFYHFDGDCFISDLDLQNIDLLKNDIYKKDKRGLIEVDIHGHDVKNKGVCVAFFILEVDFYYENFRMVRSSEEYIKNVKNGATTEFYFYQALCEKLNELDIKEVTFHREFFSNSIFGLSNYEADHFIDILSEKTKNKPILIITNPKKKLKDYKIEFLTDDNDLNETIVSILPNGYYYNILNKKVINVKIFYKKNDNWNLVYDKIPNVEVKNKKDCEYVRIE